MCVRIHLSIIHPRLLSTLLLYEPVIISTPFSGPSPSLMSAMRRDLWPSSSAANFSLKRGLKSWDRRVVERYLSFGLRRVPTPIYDPGNDSKIPLDAVTLTTTKHQESWAYSVPNFEPEAAGLDRLLLADWSAEEK